MAEVGWSMSKIEFLHKFYTFIYLIIHKRSLYSKFSRSMWKLSLIWLDIYKIWTRFASNGCKQYFLLTWSLWQLCKPGAPLQLFYFSWSMSQLTTKLSTEGYVSKSGKRVWKKMVLGNYKISLVFDINKFGIAFCTF